MTGLLGALRVGGGRPWSVRGIRDGSTSQGALVAAPAIPDGREDTRDGRPLDAPRARILDRSRWPRHWAIVSIVAAQIIGSLRLRNSAFQDEALYLWAGHQITAHVQHGVPIPENFAAYFSGAPDFYPVIGSLVDGVWGLEGARDYSLAWTVVATLCIYAITRRLFAPRFAAPAAAAFALSGPILYIGHFATFDAQCLGLLALATYAAIRAADSRVAVWAVAIGPLLTLAVFTKYAGALFIPSVFALLVVESVRRRGWWVALMNAGAALAGAALTVVVIWWRLGTGVLVGLQATTTNRVVAAKSPPWPIISHQVLPLAGFFIALALVGFIALPREWRLTGGILFGTVLLAPAYHIDIGEPVSLSKHLGFGMFFAAPLVGYALMRLAGARNHLPGRRFAAAVAVGLTLVATGFSQSSSLFSQWGNTDSLVRTLKTMVRPGSGHILVEDEQAPRYQLEDMLQWWQWTDLNFFGYKAANGANLTGKDAYLAAIRERHFDVVVLHYGDDFSNAIAVRDEMRRVGGYQLAASLPFNSSFGRGSYDVFRLTATPTPTPVPRTRP